MKRRVSAKQAENHREWQYVRPHVQNATSYINELLRLSCAPDLLALKLFPNAKEVTESFAAYAAVRKHLPEFKLSDPSITLIAVGDGHTPRTGATFAFRSAWNCYSIDPLMREHGWSTIGRLTVACAPIEEIQIRATRAVIVAVHSHARLEAAFEAVRADEVSIVAIPCCAEQTLYAVPPDLVFNDRRIASPEREVRVWRSVKPGARYEVDSEDPC